MYTVAFPTPGHRRRRRVGRVAPAEQMTLTVDRVPRIRASVYIYSSTD